LEDGLKVAKKELKKYNKSLKEIKSKHEDGYYLRYDYKLSKKKIKELEIKIADLLCEIRREEKIIKHKLEKKVN